MPSENGWNPARVNASACEWVRIPGAEHVSLQFLKGQPSQILRAYAADYHAYIEPLRDADSASYTPTNSVATSNHLNGTAMDLNWNSHPFRVDYAGFDQAKIQRMRALLDFYTFEGLKIMFWAQDWRTPKDAMHHQLGYGTYGDARVARFIAARIRPDGFSSYLRGGTTPPPVPPPPAIAISILRRAMEPTSASDATLSAYLPHFAEAMRAAEITGVKRVAAWCSQIGHESAGLKYMAEIEKSNPAWTADRTRYRGRGPIQLTWSSNYRKFGQWCVTKGYVTDPELFVKNPELVEQPKWGFLAASWYWLHGGPRPGQINGFADQGDILSVSKCVNGWVTTPNGMPDRIARYNRALALGDQLLALTQPAPPTQGDDDLSTEAERMIRELHTAFLSPIDSASPLRKPGEGKIHTLARLLRYVDGNLHPVLMRMLAELNHPDAMRDLKELADVDLTKYPECADGKDLATAILADVSKPNVTVNNVHTSSGVDLAEQLRTAMSEIKLPEPQIVYTPAPEPVTPFAGTPGQVIGAAYDALAALDLAADLPAEAKAPLTALLSVLQQKTETTK